jgi:uncharacterized phage-associated protein
MRNERGGLSTMTPKYTAFDVANYFLYKAQEATEEDQELISNLKLQKLVYYAQGLHLAINGEPLFLDRIEAWTYGPVVTELYHYYKEHGSNGIRADEKFNPSHIDEDTKKFLDEVYEVFGQFSAIRLMNLAHSDKCWIDAGIGNEITCEAMGNDLKKYLKDV